MRVVRITVVISSGEEPEPVLSGVATLYRLRTRREHNNDEMLIQSAVLVYISTLERFGSGEATDQLAGVEKVPLNVG
jgi:hypothetical protein